MKFLLKFVPQKRDLINQIITMKIYRQSRPCVTKDIISDIYGRRFILSGQNHAKPRITPPLSLSSLESILLKSRERTHNLKNT
ncbi:hypothetical protein DF142_06285 [Burkholderia cenocepacia]|nr:hypothetical protein DF142_06285 [Burkholderia cenocepacia]RQU64913.1 hypothetical protein DF140_19990 [Burkholderia cenocepacia]